MTPRLERPSESAHTQVIPPIYPEPGHFAWMYMHGSREKQPLPPIKRHEFPGLYIVFEGIGGTGKDTISTAVQRRLEGMDRSGPYKGSLYPELPVSKIRTTREPGGSYDAEILREIVTTIKLPLEMQMELFRMARENSLPRVVGPVLEQGGLMLQVRSALTSFAYQGFGFEAGADAVLDCNRFFLEKFIPDIVVWVERDVEQALSQVVDEGGKKDVFDVEIEFNKRAQDGYRKAKEVFGVCDWIYVDNSMNIYDMQQTIEIVWSQLHPKIHSWYAKTYGMPTK